MPDKDDSTINISFKLIGAITLWVCLFWGDPDIQDALIFWLTDGTLKP